MATKYQIISEVYEQELKTIATPARWQSFLRSACRNYKCQFDKQLLIFAQKPQSTAVLEIEKWNKQFNRWVNKGASGIAVFDSTNPQSKRLKYYFDVSDTHEGRNSRKVPIWQMKSSYENEVIATLESTFGELKDSSNLPQAVIGAAENAAEDNLTDYLYDLKYYIQDSFFDGLGDDYIEKTYKELATNSVAYMGSRLEAAKQQLENTKNQMANAKIEVKREFPQEAELKAKTYRLDELNILLNMDKHENEVVDGDSPDTDDTPNKKEKDYER